MHWRGRALHGICVALHLLHLWIVLLTWSLRWWNSLCSSLMLKRCSSLNSFSLASALERASLRSFPRCCCSSALACSCCSFTCTLSVSLRESLHCEFEYMLAYAEIKIRLAQCLLWLRGASTHLLLCPLETVRALAAESSLPTTLLGALDNIAFSFYKSWSENEGAKIRYAVDWPCSTASVKTRPTAHLDRQRETWMIAHNQTNGKQTLQNKDWQNCHVGLLWDEYSRSLVESGDTK